MGNACITKQLGGIGDDVRSFSARKSPGAPPLACGALLAAAPAFAQAQCERADLQAVADGYIAAQTAGVPSKIPMGLWVQYNEQADLASMATGLLSQPQKIDFHRTLIDTTTCSTFTEVVITDPAHPYVLGVRLQARGGQVGAIDMLITDNGDWLFNAANTLKYSSAEKWTEIPEADRDSRETLLAARQRLSERVQRQDRGRAVGQPLRTAGGRALHRQGRARRVPARRQLQRRRAHRPQAGGPQLCGRRDPGRGVR